MRVKTEGADSSCGYDGVPTIAPIIENSFANNCENKMRVRMLKILIQKHREEIIRYEKLLEEIQRGRKNDWW